MVQRRLGAVAVVLALLATASGCSLREVQLWFAVNRKQDISRDQARAIAHAVNAKKAPGPWCIRFAHLDASDGPGSAGNLSCRMADS